jgi:hypothetical protein
MARRASHKHVATLIHREAPPPTASPHSRPIRDPQSTLGKNQKGMAMTKQEENLARERKEIAARVASFKATQEKFRREREQYFATTLENARNGIEGKSC